MSALADLKTQVDTLAATVPKLTTALTTAQAQIIDLHGKLDAAIANAEDPAVLQSIKDELTGVQGTVDDAVSHSTTVTDATTATSTAADGVSDPAAGSVSVPNGDTSTAVPQPNGPVVVTQASGPVSTDAATIAASARTGAGNL